MFKKLRIEEFYPVNGVTWEVMWILAGKFLMGAVKMRTVVDITKVLQDEVEVSSFSICH